MGALEHFASAKQRNNFHSNDRKVFVSIHEHTQVSYSSYIMIDL